MQNQGSRTAMHTLILSPGDNNVNMEDYTRDSMSALEERMGHDLDWYGVIHQNTDHHHAHVVIAGKVPGHERELEKREQNEWTSDLQKMTDRELGWKNQEQDIRELIGARYDEKAATDPREDRAAERSRWGDGEREPIDPSVKDLVDDNARSPSEFKTEKMLDRYEQEMAARETAESRKEVFLDRDDLKELRSAGNDYVHRERSLERSLEYALEREFGQEPTREHGRDREMDLDQSEWSDISQMFDQGREAVREPTEREDDEREHERNDFDRGR